MGKKLCPKIILEGTRLTLKTEIAFALNEHPQIVGPRKYQYHSPLISAEWCAFTNFPWGRGLINFEPQEEARAMETYRTWMHLLELLPYYSWIIDRFHISTMVYQWQHLGKKYDFHWLEDRLGAIGFRLVFCTRSPDAFAEAKEARLKVSGNPSQYDNLDIFVEEQETFKKFIQESSLPVLEVDVSDNDIPRITQQIASWLNETGGLWANY
jgi:hypothetical protein